MAIAIITAASLDELRERLIDHAPLMARTIEIYCTLGGDLVEGRIEATDRFVDFRLVRVDPLAPAARAIIARASLNARDTYRENEGGSFERLLNGSKIFVEADDDARWANAIVDAVHVARCLSDDFGSSVEPDDLASIEG